MTGSTDTERVYPVEREADVLLRDGSTVHVRPVRAGDADAIRAFLEHISPDSIAFRFFGIPNLDWVVRWSLDVDYADRFALVAESGTPPTIIAHAAYVRENAERAEVAFLVADEWQGRGISTTLLAHLAAVAEAHGLTTFTAQVMPTNYRMIEVFGQSGFPVEMRSTPDAIEIELPTSLSPEALMQFEERDRIAAVAAVRSVLEPRSVAVIGAGRNRGTVGGEVLHNLLAAEFNGPVYAVNDHAEVVQSLPAYRSVIDIPGGVDLAVIVVPAAQVVSVAQECAVAKARALVVISSGFAESGEIGAQRQAELVGICRDAGIRIVGPNCLGVLNTAPGVRLNATFAPRPSLGGGIGFMSQSGGLGIAIIGAAAGWASGSPRSCRSATRWTSPATTCSSTGSRTPARSSRCCTSSPSAMRGSSRGSPHGSLGASRCSPSRAAARPPEPALAIHTGALLAASDATVDALFEQAGVIRADTLQELFSVASLLQSQPIPRGDRVAIVTNAGGPGIMCADACQAHGVSVSELADDVQQALREFLPPDASVGNPIDMIATATPQDYRRTLEVLIEHDACDAILAIFVPPLVTEAEQVALALCEVAETRPAVALAAVFMTGDDPPAQLRSDEMQVPGFAYPEDAARAIAWPRDHGRWRAQPALEAMPALSGPLRSDAAAAVISSQLAAGVGWLDPGAVVELLACYGLPLIETRVVAGAEEAAAAAIELGVPIALKGHARGLLHKTDAGAVRLGVQADEVGDAFDAIEAAVRRQGLELDGVVVQPMGAPGVELIIGVVNDHSFGPVVACGAGGTTAELIKDIAVRITPLSRADAQQMLTSLRTFPSSTATGALSAATSGRSRTSSCG